MVHPQSPKSPTTQTSSKPTSLKRRANHKLDRLTQAIREDPVIERGHPVRQSRKSQQHVCSEPQPIGS